MIAWGELIGPALTIEHLRPIADAGQLRDKLQELLAPTWSTLWRKAPKKKNTARTKRSVEIPGGHTSMYRLLRTATSTERKRLEK